MRRGKPQIFSGTDSIREWRRRFVRWISFFGLLGLPSIALAQEDKARWVSNMFDPLSTPALKIHEISLLVLMICAGIFVIVAGLLTYTIFRFRTKPGDDKKEPPQIYGSTQIELAWTVVPILIVFALILVTARTVAEIQDFVPPEDAVKIRVVGRQWWWEVHYPDLNITTANEIHIPVNKVASFALNSGDVVHSFWVPQLAGKMDVIPRKGEDNHLWMEPSVTGLFPGNCAEFCGTQHANMLIRVYVDTEEDFQKWVKSQQAPAVESTSVAKGKEVFFSNSCANCHKIEGTIAQGTFGPDLTHLMTRSSIGSGVALNTHENLWNWVRDPQKMKPGALMPDMALTKEEVDQVVDYLSTLK